MEVIPSSESNVANTMPPTQDRPLRPRLRISCFSQARERRTGAWYYHMAKKILAIDPRFKDHLRMKGLANYHVENVYLVCRWETSELAITERNIRQARNKHYLQKAKDEDALREMLEEMDAMQLEMTPLDASTVNAATNKVFDMPISDGHSKEPTRKRRFTNPHCSVRFMADFGYGPVEVITYDPPCSQPCSEITFGPCPSSRKRDPTLDSLDGSKAASIVTQVGECYVATSLSMVPDGMEDTVAEDEEVDSQLD